MVMRGFASLERRHPRTICQRDAHNPRCPAISTQLAAHLSVMVAIPASGECLPPFAITVGKQVNPWSRMAPSGTEFAVS
jgi:hypothetical protein